MSLRSVSSAAIDVPSVPSPTSGMSTRATVCDGFTSTSIEPAFSCAASTFVFNAASACCVAGASMSALIATWLWLTSPSEKAALTFLIVPTVGALFGNAFMPLCAVCRWRTGSAISTSAPPATAAAMPGRRIAGSRIFFHTRFSPLSSRRSRCRKGILPFSTRSPSFERSAGSTVSEPSIAMPTTIIVAMPKPRYDLSPANIIPAIAIITVKPEMSTERPEVAAAASRAAREPLPAARSSRSRLR
jgi:hypothetical protein